MMNRTTIVGVLGGSVTSIAGILGYFVFPLLFGDGHWYEMGWEAYQTFSTSSYAYHAVVLVAPSFTAVFLGTLVARKLGEASGVTDVKLLVLNVGLPVATVVLSYLVSSVIFGLAVSVGASRPIEAIGFFIVFLMYNLVFGFLFVVIAVGGVLIAVTIGSVSGYVLARSIGYGWKRVHSYWSVE